MKVSIFGDSIVWGAYDLEFGGWVNRLKLYFNNKGDFVTDIYNHGISGDRVSDVLNRLDTEAKAVMPDKIILAIGINDTPIPEFPSGTDPNKFKDLYQKLISKAKQHSKSQLIVGLTNVDEKIAGHGYKNKEIEKLNNIIKELAQKESIALVDLFGSLSDDDVMDGLHPNSKGHQKIYEKVKNLL
jgi:lysophospholipase L1-like esterase